MNSYEMMIDPTNFGTVALYLRNPRSPIDHVLHVRDRAALAGLAEKLAPFAITGQTTPADLPALLAEPLKTGEIKISSRLPLTFATPEQVVEAASIPRMAGCEVIFLPPFYLVHTHGLFEGTLPKVSAEKQTETHHHSIRPRPFKF